MKELWYIMLLLVLIIVEAIPFLKTCKKYGMNYAIKELIQIMTIAGIVLFILGSVFYLIKIEQSQERMRLTVQECNELIGFVKGR